MTTIHYYCEYCEVDVEQSNVEDGDLHVGPYACFSRSIVESMTPAEINCWDARNQEYVGDEI